MFSTTKKSRKSPSNVNRLQGIQDLEKRRLMAGDTMQFHFFQGAEAEQAEAEIGQLVDGLADSVQEALGQDFSPEELRPDVIMALAGGPEWINLIDESQIPELGNLLGQNDALASGLSELVFLELSQKNGQNFESQVDFFLAELDCELAQLSENDFDSLPPQFEQLRTELGDQGFADFLQSNIEQSGNISGISDAEIEQIVDSGQVNQFEQQEQALEAWLRGFQAAEEPMVDQPVVVDPPVIVDPPIIIDPPIIDPPIIDPPVVVAPPVNIDPPIVDPPATNELPGQFEQLRQELGDELFGELLRSNLEQFGNFAGVTDGWIERLVSEGQGLVDQYEQQEQALEDWLEQHANGGTAPKLNGDTNADGEVDFSDFLRVSQNFGQTVDFGYLEGDFNFDGIVGFSDFLVVSENFGNTTSSQPIPIVEFVFEAIQQRDATFVEFELDQPEVQIWFDFDFDVEQVCDEVVGCTEDILGEILGFDVNDADFDPIQTLLRLASDGNQAADSPMFPFANLLISDDTENPPANAGEEAKKLVEDEAKDKIKEAVEKSLNESAEKASKEAAEAKADAAAKQKAAKASADKASEASKAANRADNVAQDARDRAVNKKVAQEAAEKAAKEKAEDVTQKKAAEKAAKEAAERAKREASNAAAEEAAQKAAQAKATREAAEKASREAAEKAAKAKAEKEIALELAQKTTKEAVDAGKKEAIERAGSKVAKEAAEKATKEAVKKGVKHVAKKAIAKVIPGYNAIDTAKDVFDAGYATGTALINTKVGKNETVGDWWAKKLSKNSAVRWAFGFSD